MMARGCAYGSMHFVYRNKIFPLAIFVSGDGLYIAVLIIAQAFPVLENSRATTRKGLRTLFVLRYFLFVFFRGKRFPVISDCAPVKNDHSVTKFVYCVDVM